MQSGFGMRTDPFSGEGAFHKGVDISSAYGTPVHVTADGIVVLRRVGRAVMDGWSAWTMAAALQTCYAHLSKFFVHTGQAMRRGEVRGTRSAVRAAPPLRTSTTKCG